MARHSFRNVIYQQSLKAHPASTAKMTLAPLEFSVEAQVDAHDGR